MAGGDPVSGRDLDQAIRARLDDYDGARDTTGCPSDPECLHAAVAAGRAVLDLHHGEDDANQDSRFCVACDHPWPCPTVRALARGLGVNPKETK